MQNKIKYISFYDLQNQKHKRVSSLAAISQVDYVCSVLESLNYQVQIVSPSWFLNVKDNTKFKSSYSEKTQNNVDIKFAPSIISINKYLGYFNILLSLFWLFFYLIRNIKRDEKVIMYHSPWLVFPVFLAKKIKNFNLILEVEEIYSDCSSLHSFFDKLEKKAFKYANSFLFSTEFLAEKLAKNRSFAVFYGNYKVFPKLNTPINDGKIHLLYAGIIDSVKAGAFNAIESALFLNEKYQMHIIGSGEVEKLKKRINEINATSLCKIVFDGQLSGDDYIKYCQSCHIGLSTQKMEAGFVDSSFPSKILSYLGMGLQVVSCYVSVVVKSKIADNVSFYDIDSPEKIAEAIQKINIENSSSTQIKMENLHSDFKNQLNVLLNSK